ncbi:MAG: tRNA epoxyqueuosine(34) reductase QueG [Candidatus Izimaplasma sp.]|nr:tRNA epoxyqueuosine(34) reductase QueG [Candidatus Izimaplasma bacterium]
MKKTISNILIEHVDVFGFVSISEYLKARFSYGKEDSFSRIPDFDKYRTIIVLGLSYPSEEVKYQGKGYGVLSRYSYNTDYHIVFKRIFRKIETELNKLNIKSYFSVDISDIFEKQAASLANIGYIGKNQLLINPKFGSYLNLATILIDIDISKNMVISDDCGDCTLCIDACPSNALDNGFDRSKCISDISQKKNILNMKEISYFKKVIYGCDICQQVCPKNKGIDFHLHEEYEPSGIENINLTKLLKMTNKEFKEVYGNNASSWTGPLVLKRNAVCAIGNQNIKYAIPEIKKSIDKYKAVSWYNETAQKVLKMLESE